jgi:V/A-type H+-transporting ATPase subunit I
MSGLTTAKMSRILVVGTIDELNPTLELAAQMKAIHVIDHDGVEIEIGSPNEAADDISRRLAVMRGCLSHLNSAASDDVIPVQKMRDSLDDSLSDLIESVVGDIKRLEVVETELEQLQEQIDVLKSLVPLGLELEVFSGYDSLSVSVGIVSNLSQCKADLGNLSDDIFVFSHSVKGKSGIIAVFCEVSSAEAIENILSEHMFQPIAAPSGEGSPKDLLTSLNEQVTALEAEKDELSSGLDSWNDKNGGMLVGGIEILERDFEIETAPVRVGTSKHSFVMEGWVLTDESRATTEALSKVATHVECKEFEMPYGRGHHFTGEEIELPPIAFQNIGLATPYELLTDAVGRPKYGRVDPTTFMFITYPLFFGIMLGDIAYGLAIVALAWYLSKKFARNDLVLKASMLLFYIGFSTILFGYLFGEFAGFEYLPHGHCDIEGIVGVAQCHVEGGHYGWDDAHAPAWTTWLTALYPHGGEIHYMWEGNFGLVLAYPFHRVSSNINDLMILTLYLGIFHLALGMIIGFRDVNKEHGFTAAMFEKGSWLLILVGGFLFIYSFLVSPNHSDEAYLELLGMLESIGLVLLSVGVVMVIIMLWKYEGIPLPIAIGLGPLESLQVLSNTISYVRLFAVGIVGVKIAETGNIMIYEPLVHILSDISHAGVLDIILIPVLLVSWLLVQLFALVLGMFSPNVQAARLHFVEWMGKFYETGGEPFAPFGKEAINVEAD